jgi:hypothetical protein
MDLHGGHGGLPFTVRVWSSGCGARSRDRPETASFDGADRTNALGHRMQRQGLALQKISLQKGVDCFGTSLIQRQHENRSDVQANLGYGLEDRSNFVYPHQVCFELIYAA